MSKLHMSELDERELLEAALRVLPCGSHPRLLSLGQPARFAGGCGEPIFAFEAIRCADCMAWFCSRDCAVRHFKSHAAAPCGIGRTEL